MAIIPYTPSFRAVSSLSPTQPAIHHHSPPHTTTSSSHSPNFQFLSPTVAVPAFTRQPKTGNLPRIQQLLHGTFPKVSALAVDAARLELFGQNAHVSCEAEQQTQAHGPSAGSLPPELCTSPAAGLACTTACSTTLCQPDPHSCPVPPPHTPRPTSHPSPHQTHRATTMVCPM